MKSIWNPLSLILSSYHQIIISFAKNVDESKSQYKKHSPCLIIIDSTFENNIKLGESSGTYKLIDEKGQCLINIRYNNVFNSPNKNSPFHIQNMFYPKLSNYTLGPFYTVIPKEDVIWLPVLYNHLQIEKGFKVLNFYKKNI